jgi:hypothetical protein
MARRILDLTRHDLVGLRGRRLTEAVGAAEGRTLVAEVVAAGPGLVDGVHNAELMAAMGADIVILNFIELARAENGWLFGDVGHVSDFETLARRIGRPVGVNLEPGDVPDLRKATVENAKRLVGEGAALLCLTANPGTGTTLDDLARVTTTLRRALGDSPALWTGKMHQAGRDERLSADRLVRLVDAGADGVLLPLPGTVPGVSRESAAATCEAVHNAGALVMGTVGTSQEGARPDIATPLALLAKEIGVDAHHLGDAGLARTADPDLVYAYSIAIRGRRHTWRRMAWSNRRD